MSEELYDTAAPSAAADGAPPTGSDAPEEDRLSLRNLICFPAGTLGRDFLYGLFTNYIMMYILFTKHLSAVQFSMITVIIVAARIFDAFNDPVMGGIVENTRTKWGKFKPWQLIGAVLTGGVIIAAFSTNLQGWAFIGFLAFIYFAFSITFTMNDISYWGMMPSLTRNPHDRSKVTSFAQLVAGAGGGLVGLLVPVLTTGKLALKGSASMGFMLIAIIASIIMILFQLVTIFGVKEKPLPAAIEKVKPMGVKQMFRIIFKNDQLMWSALVMLLFCIGTNVVGGGLSMSYLYFEFGYNGMLLTLFGILYGVFSTAFTLFFPWINKKFTRNQLMLTAAIAIIGGYALMFILGAALPSNPWYFKFAGLVISNGIVGFGQGAFYMIMFINIANTVEYNEWKTGQRDEGLIFSLRPFTAKMGSALMQLLVMGVYLGVGVLTYTNQISDFENAYTMKKITEQEKLDGISQVIASVSQDQKIALLACMCIIPIIFIIVAIILYRKKFFITEDFHKNMVREIKDRVKAGGLISDSDIALMAAAETAAASGNLGITSVSPEIAAPGFAADATADESDPYVDYGDKGDTYVDFGSDETDLPD